MAGQYFIPNTTIYLFRNTGIDAKNKPYIKSHENFFGFLTSTGIYHTFTNYSYQRADERQYVAVNLDYNIAIECDLLMWQNKEHENEYAGESRWYVANVTGVEFKNPNTTWIYFEIDAYCTFAEDINWATSVCFVEREHVNKDWNGDIPNYENIGVSEGMNPVLEKPLFAYVYYSSDVNQFVVRDPYIDTDASGGIGGIVRDNVFGMSAHVFDSSAEVNAYLKKLADSDKADVEKVVDIQTIPKYVANYQQVYLKSPWSQVTYNNAKCYSSEFCLLRVESLAGDTVSYKPELFGDSDLNNIHFFMQLMAPGGSYCMLVYPTQYPKGGGNSGKYYGFKIADFPHGNFSVDTFAQWLTVNLLPSAIRGGVGALQAVSGAGTTIAGVATGNPAAGMMGIMQATHGVENLVNTVTEFNNARMHGTSVSGEFGMTNAAFAAACNQLGYCMSWYMPNDPTMAFVDSYFDRFGYKVMKLKVPNIHTRKYWNYVKTIEAHISGSIPYFYVRKIEAMLNSGVTFWNIDAGRIGDFSNPSKNKEEI